MLQCVNGSTGLCSRVNQLCSLAPSGLDPSILSLSSVSCGTPLSTGSPLPPLPTSISSHIYPTLYPRRPAHPPPPPPPDRLLCPPLIFCLKSPDENGATGSDRFGRSGPVIKACRRRPPETRISVIAVLVYSSHLGLIPLRFLWPRLLTGNKKNTLDCWRGSGLSWPLPSLTSTPTISTFITTSSQMG